MSKVIMFIFTLLSVVAYAKQKPGPNETNLGVVKSWPTQCLNEKTYQDDCQSTALVCSSYLINGTYVPDLCNTRTCQFWCKGYAFSIETKTE